MCNVSGELRQAAVELIPKPYRNRFVEFVVRLGELYRLRTLILFGSTARGQNRPGSDIDLIAVSECFDDDFFKRMQDIYSLRRGLPLDCFAYKPQEFDDMLWEFNVSVLDALTEGVPIIGEAWFRQRAQVVEGWRARGLKKGKTAWIWPKEITPANLPCR